MPGTIQVSVLEFKGLPSKSPPSILKVSLGKIEYQTSDMGNFSFPLTTLRDNLLVTIQDAERNEIAHTGIQTMLIVEKVSWDDIFPFDGGGYVHLILQFILSEEEQNRIRSLREDALKKKQGVMASTSPRHSEIESLEGDSVTSSQPAMQMSSDSQTKTVLRVASLEDVSVQASPLSNLGTFYESSQYNYGKEGGSVLKQEIPKAKDKREEACSDPRVLVHPPEAYERAYVKKIETQLSLPKVRIKPVSSQDTTSKLRYSGSDVAAKSSSVPLKVVDDRGNKSEQQGPLEKTPSTVRKLVSTFEGGVAQDVKSPLKLSAVKFEQKKVGKGGHLDDSVRKDATEPAESSSGSHKNPFVAGDLGDASKRGDIINSAESFVGNILSESINRLKQSASEVIDLRRKESSTWVKSPEDSERTSTTQTAKLDVHSGRVYSFGSTKQQDSDGISLAGTEGRKSSAEISIQVASNEKSNTLEYREEELFDFQNSGMWILPNDRKHFCITTAGKRIMHLLGGFRAEARSHQNKSSSTSGHADKHGTDYEKKKDNKKSNNTRKSRSESSSDDASGGLVGQAIKIAIIVSFGVFVLLTRQREPRKGNRDSRDRDTNNLLFTTPEYDMEDEQILTDE